MTTLSIPEFWKKIKEGSKDKWIRITEFTLNNFGTALSCNRFAVGEVIEDATEVFLNDIGIISNCIPSAKRIDIQICNVSGLDAISSKFVSTDGHVILHNAQRSVVTDKEVHPTLLFLMTEWWFIYPPHIKAMGIDISDKKYLSSTGDSLRLNFTLLDDLRAKNYPYFIKQGISYDKSKCKMKATSDLTYKIVNDLLNPDIPPVIRSYLENLMETIPSRRGTRVEITSYTKEGDLKNMTLPQLKQYCSEKKLSKSGNKNSLINRILESFKSP